MQPCVGAPCPNPWIRRPARRVAVETARDAVVGAGVLCAARRRGGGATRRALPRPPHGRGTCVGRGAQVPLVSCRAPAGTEDALPRRHYFFGGTAGIPRNGSRSAPNASGGTTGLRGFTGVRRR
ncbi:hypothetical protein GCM10018787_15080 [Streptomyces thermodiastaticus]|nr:hypothetical protein GCM10018787_15080 [Streptomyces thermodiastaticus]